MKTFKQFISEGYFSDNNPDKKIRYKKVKINKNGDTEHEAYYQGTKITNVIHHKDGQATIRDQHGNTTKFESKNKAAKHINYLVHG